MSYHFIGLGGIGMSAIARVLLQQGRTVQGSDLHPSPLLDQLEKEGAVVCIGHFENALSDAKTVVYSSGISEDNPEWMDAKKRNLPILHRSDLLNDLMQGKKKIIVSGTHGKTTTTALAAWTFMEAGLDPSFVVGGLIATLNTNGKAGKGDYFIAEGDESDGSFLKSTPHAAIITNLSDDHLDYWGSSQALEAGFVQFIEKSENVFWCADDPRLVSLHPKGISYGFSSKANLQICNFRESPQGIVFDIHEHRNIELSLAGRHNALNAAAVFAMAMHFQIPVESIRRAFASFTGTQRRLERKAERHSVVLYDDYGHHPREIIATLNALRGKIRERRLVVVFQPHRYSRVRDLFEEFTTCFSEADEIFLTDIYSAGEKPIDGISSAALYTRMREKLGAKLHFLPRSYLESGVATALKPFDVLLTLGAGDVTKAGIPILEQFAARAPKLKCALLFGGASSEHNVSLLTMQNVLKALDSSLFDVVPFGLTREGDWVLGYDLKMKASGSKIPPAVLEALSSCDVSIPAFHGPFGEDGMIAGILEALQIPYVGCGYKSGALCMQKAWSKYIARAHNVPTAPFLEITKEPDSVEKIEAHLSYPIWVKPVSLGSSIGVERVQNRQELTIALEQAHRLDRQVICEQEVSGRQIEFAVLGNDYVRVAFPGEIVNEGNFVGYEQKYGSGAMKIRVPAHVSQEELERGKELAEKVYRACDCKGLARVDFFLDDMGQYWFNEINPFPGCTDTSAYPAIWEKEGLSMRELVNEWVMLALQKHRMTASFVKQGALFNK